MKIVPITSPANPLLKKVRGLHRRADREKSGLFLVEGAKLVAESYEKGIVVRDVLVSQSFLKEGMGETHAANITAISVVDDKTFHELVTTEGPCGIVAIAEMPRWDLEGIFSGGSSLVIIAEAIQDPGNLGTMIRTALAGRASGMILTKGCVDPFNPKVVRSAAGAIFMLPIVMDLPIDQAIRTVKEHNLKVIACDPSAEKNYWEADMSGPIALAFGNEGQGFSSAVISQADQAVVIPMSENSESLNVAVSASIVLFGAVQQRLQRTARPM